MILVRVNVRKCSVLTKELFITIPVPITENHAFFYRKGMKILNKRGKEWMKNAEHLMRLAMEEQGWETVENEKVIVELWHYWPDKRVRDCSNSLKLLCDSIQNAGIVNNDRWLLCRQQDFSVDRDNPRLEMRIRRFNDGSV